MSGSIQEEVFTVESSLIRRAGRTPRSTAILTLACAALVFAGCNSQASPPSAAGANAGLAPSSAPATPPGAVDPSTAGSITGTVTLSGPPPAPKWIYMVSEPMCEREHGGPVRSPEVIVASDGALANAVVYIKSGLGNYRFATPNEPVHLAQKGCMYDPHVLALMVGQTLEVSNDDQTLHNVHAMPKINPAWNRGQAGGQPPIEQAFSQEELAIPIQCNIHPWMRCYVFAFHSPYFSISSKSGKFELKNVPPGTYRIEAWQEKYGTIGQTVTLAPNESKSVSFAFDAAAAARQ